MPRVRFLREGVEVEAADGSDLRSVAREAGVQLYAGPHRLLNCHGMGSCGSCRVLLENGTEGGLAPAGAKERVRKTLSYFAIGRGDELRLACQAKVVGDVDVMTQPPMNRSGNYAPEAEAARKRIEAGRS